jgi:hypothetical protein
MVGDITGLTIVEAWSELKSTDNKIDLLETLRTTKKGIKNIKLKEILVSGGKVNNSGILNAIIECDEYSEQLHELYKAKNAYEKYIFEEVDRLKRTNPSIVIGFLKEYQKLNWEEISKITIYSIAQARRYYDDYKGKTPKNNTFIKDEQK